MRDLEEMSFQPASNTIDPQLGFPGNIDDSSSSPYPPLEFTVDSFQQNLDLLNSSFLFNHSHPQADPRESLLSKLHTLKEELSSLGHHLSSNLGDGSTAVETPSMDEDSPISTALHFTSWRVTVAYSCFWSLQILTNRLIMKLLPPHDSNYYVLEGECRTIALEICKTWEDAWASKPIGAFHTSLSFVMAYEFCTPDVQEWILRGMNNLLDYQAVDNSFRWSHQMVALMSGKLAGEGPP